MITIQEWQRSHNLRRGASEKARELCRDKKVPGATQPGGSRTQWRLTDDSFAYLNQKHDEGYFNKFKTNKKLDSGFREIS